jgi:ribosome maturation factor RimP
MTQRGRAVGGSTAAPRGAGRARDDLPARRGRLRAVVEPVVAAEGYDLEELSISRAGRRHVVRVIVDGEGGVSLDAIADVSRAVSAALDKAEAVGGDLVDGEYQLEVSSPGIDRPLTLPRHWRRNVGRLVKVTVKGPGRWAQAVAPGDRQVTGRVSAADDEGVVLQLDGGSAEWAYADLGPGRVQVEFNRLNELSDEDLEDTDTGEVDDGEVEDEER